MFGIILVVSVLLPNTLLIGAVPNTDENKANVYFTEQQNKNNNVGAEQRAHVTPHNKSNLAKRGSITEGKQPSTTLQRSKRFFDDNDGDNTLPPQTLYDASNKQKRWVDVDEDDTDTKNGNREKTPSEPSDMTSLSNLVGDLDKGLSSRFKTINDITNLQAAETQQPSIEPGPMINGGINVDPNHLLQDPEPPGMVQGSPRMLSLPTNEQVMGEPIPIGGNNFQGNRLGHELMEELSHGVGEQFRNGELGIPIEAFQGGLQGFQGGVPYQHLPPPRALFHGDNVHVSSSPHVYHTRDSPPEIIVPAGNVLSGPPEHRTEGPIHRMEPGPILQKVIPGKSLYLKPIRIIHRRPQNIFRHLHVYHRPRIIVIRRHHRHHFGKFFVFLKVES